MSTDKSVTAVACGRWESFLIWLACFWQVNLIFVIFCWAVVTGAVMAALDGNLRPGLVRPVANAVGVPVALLGCGGYIWYSASQLARAHLCIDGTEVTFRGHVVWRGVVERRYQLNELAAVTLGQPLNAVEQVLNRFNMAGPSLFLKDGRLLVTDLYGEQTIFQFMNMAFDQAQVRAFVTELSCRGVGYAPRAEPDHGS